MSDNKFSTMNIARNTVKVMSALNILLQNLLTQATTTIIMVICKNRKEISLKEFNHGSFVLLSK